MSVFFLFFSTRVRVCVCVWVLHAFCQARREPRESGSHCAASVQGRAIRVLPLPFDVLCYGRQEGFFVSLRTRPPTPRLPEKSVYDAPSEATLKREIHNPSRLSESWPAVLLSDGCRTRQLCALTSHTFRLDLSLFLLLLLFSFSFSFLLLLPSPSFSSSFSCSSSFSFFFSFLSPSPSLSRLVVGTR